MHVIVVSTLKPTLTRAGNSGCESTEIDEVPIYEMAVCP